MFIAVHGGAGNLSQKSDKEVRKILRTACQCAQAENDTSPRDVIQHVETAIKVLEDADVFNAGYGSNLTLSQTVECDASIMSARLQDFGAVGSLASVRNPIRVARELLGVNRVPDSLGRIQPMLLVGQGAQDFAQRFPDTIVPPESLITPKARELWLRWTNDGNDEVMQDTVGAIAFGKGDDGLLDGAAGVSSGGLLLKYPGRVGEAAIYGAGCWADMQNGIGILCSISGAGEYIMRAALAKSASEAVSKALQFDEDIHDALEQVFTSFCNNTKRRDPRRPNAGAIIMTSVEKEDDVQVRLWVVFTAASMSIAYKSPGMPKVKSEVLRHPNPTASDPSIYITAITLE
ncbi:N-terminal nucleophile aminohydrolase [Cylindrobasidium torrendii FP15055 ss-10]|uniref:N-terminal nucleophile aminohydrolase n=1 Tax=Cylindrobasidium torrendii FP15055 ss-10 TaxID=1314674 RepID=A0A0D7BW55_9AGAR|nr:N-terminal nucleophile aminohydrolase [Cylindrobasidium torrendii FP15055 ss-10]